MVLFVDKTCVFKRDQMGIPGEVILEMSNGEKITFKRSDQDNSNAKSKLASFIQPEYKLSEEKLDEQTFDFEDLRTNLALQLRSLDEEYKSSVDEADQLYLLEKTEIEDFAEKRGNEIEQLYKSISKNMLRSYKGLKKEIDTKAERLGRPEVMLKVMLDCLRKTDVSELIEAAQMLELESKYILERLKSSEIKWDCFLSHVQKESADVCRNIAEKLQKSGLSVWLDKNAERLDKHGMVDGIVNSKIFVIFLTTKYFQRPYCIFEYCVAIMTGTSVITVAESDPRYGGGPIGSFQFHKLFKHILNHEVIDVHRSYWNAFTLKLQERIKSTLNSSQIDNMGEEALWDIQKITINLGILADKCTVISNSDNFWQTAVGTQQLQYGRQRFAVEIINKGSMEIGVVPPTFEIKESYNIGNHGGWAYAHIGTIKGIGSTWNAYAGKEKYGIGDVITVEVDFNKTTITFFKNGKSLGVAFDNVTSPVYPAITIFGNASVRLMSAKKE